MKRVKNLINATISETNPNAIVMKKIIDIYIFLNFNDFLANCLFCHFTPNVAMTAFKI